MPQEKPQISDFEPLVHALNDEGVEFVLIGGLAAWLHGSGRSTLDIDILYRRDDANHVRIVAAVAPFAPYLRGAPPGLPFLFDAKTISAGGNFTLTTSAGYIDLLASIAGGDYDTLLPHTTAMGVFGRECRVLDLPTLIRVKRAAGRPKDFEAIAELERILEEHPPE